MDGSGFELPLGKPIATKDGWVCITANTNEQVFGFFDAIGRPEFKTDPRFNSVAARFANVKEYFEIRRDGIKQKTTAEWLEILDQADIPELEAARREAQEKGTIPLSEFMARLGL